MIKDIITDITYKPGWTINLYYRGERPYIQLSVNGTDAVNKEPYSWKSGKRFLSNHMCRQEVVSAVFGLIRDAEEHEMREWFRYRGVSIFNPHLDPDALVGVASRKVNYNFRE